MVTWSFLHKQKIINVTSIRVTATVCFDTGNTSFHNHFTGGRGTGESWSFIKSATVSQVFPMQTTVLHHSYSWVSVNTFFPLRTTRAGDSLAILDSEKVALDRMASFTYNILLSQRQTYALYNSFPNKSHSILSSIHCISMCCLLRLAKKINYFQQKPCCVLIRKEVVEILMVLKTKNPTHAVLY